MSTASNSIVKVDAFDQDICYFIDDLLLALLFRNNLIGRMYLRDCLVLVCQQDKHTVNLSEEIYPVLAKRYSTTPASVSKAIRHCLITCYNDGNLKRANRIFRYEIIGNVPPTNAEFISTMAIFIKRYLRAREDGNSRFTYFNL